MATDLTTARDHPAALLDAAANPYPASILWKYERDNGVTFAALDNDALAAVREAYARMQEAPRNSGDRNLARIDLADAVADLLGLE